MLFPAINDTIIAVSSGWQASPLGIVRLSGPGAWEYAASVGLRLPMAGADGGRGPFITENGRITAGQLEFPGTACWFKAPRSYTGQDLVELHVPGCLPLLRELCARLIERGARRALPGEFTARAYLAGKLSVEQVEDVLATISADRDSE
ncbi:MAG TPA: tRNA uridine-5-carboxymethylaminomethyl(34) synthesis GTPase MnmE, partial [Phycisphaerae bacterium]|nr:tRNA uridine-5-carboxymethylaminomethyl(34) synthesis GTPase MnmE [Phycisphaerae bacterium]HPC22599.1 tRNA uridine-5-carboxymethylaminomethyl(34) synthesis GTPase MnmE [Phycisphaerae bacterium]